MAVPFYVIGSSPKVETLFDGEIEIGFREWFAPQGEMPPLSRIAFKAMFFHNIFQQQAIAHLLFSCFPVRRVGKLVKTVKTCPHVETVILEAFPRGEIAFVECISRLIRGLPGRRERYYSEVDAAAPAVAGSGADISFPEKVAFFYGRIELLFGFCVVHVLRPSYKMIDGTLRPVAVVNL